MEQDDRKASMCAWHLTRSPLFSSRHLRSASTSQDAAAVAFFPSPVPLTALVPATGVDGAAAGSIAAHHNHSPPHVAEQHITTTRLLAAFTIIGYG
ncbi:hypothetical protein EJB05_44155, partial [Eragrostis curvula]